MRLQLTPVQNRVFKSALKRNVAWCAGRRSGKSWLIRAITWASATTDDDGNPARGRNVLVTGRTYTETKAQLFRPFVNWLEEVSEQMETPLIAELNQSDMVVRLINDSTIMWRSGNTPEGLRGWSLDRYIGDEFAFSSPDLYPTVEPALADRQGKSFLCSSPNGFNHFYDLYQLASSPDDLVQKHWRSFTTTTAEGGLVDLERIELAKRTLSTRQFNQEYLASFENMEGVVYLEFTPDHVTDEIYLTPEKVLLVGLDFNVGLCSAVFGQTVKDQLWVVREKEVLGYTRDVVTYIREAFPEWKPNRIVVYPDASGNARKTSSNTTDHAILKAAGFHVVSPKKNPLHIDRVNTVNGLFRSASDEYRFFIHPRCEQLIKSYRGLTWRNGEIDKTSGLDHMADASDYMAIGVFPMIKRQIVGAKA